MTKSWYEKGSVWLAIALFCLIFAGFLFWFFPKWGVWQQELSGKAKFKEAEWSRQIAIEEAQANLESEKLNALAEVERAKGVAESNMIIGEGLKNNEEYIKYLWVKGLSDGSSEVIYVPTESNLPILEANRF